MIRYSLKCARGHVFDAWFRDSAAFDSSASAGQVTCAVCGTKKVEKSVMAPSVAGGRQDAPEVPDAPLSQPASPAEAALARLREHLAENSDYVGTEFPDEARRIHVGESDKRSIWGEASVEDARALRDEGVPVAPIPWMSRRND